MQKINPNLKIQFSYSDWNSNLVLKDHECSLFFELVQISWHLFLIQVDDFPKSPLLNFELKFNETVLLSRKICQFCRNGEQKGFFEN